MNDALIIIKRLNEWAKKNQVPIIGELNKIECKLSEFYRKSVADQIKKPTIKKKPIKGKLKNVSVTHSDVKFTEQINFKVKKL
ncbi:hypothetical protein [Aeromonas veronii]|uniref:hypothetical protein n=1 Tax=Aeromonas veronii TaxID=654 RepID=UPI003D1A6452